MYISVASAENAMEPVVLGKGDLFVIYVRSSVWCFYVNVVELRTQRSCSTYPKEGSNLNPLCYRLFTMYYVIS